MLRSRAVRDIVAVAFIAVAGFTEGARFAGGIQRCPERKGSGAAGERRARDNPVHQAETPGFLRVNPVTRPGEISRLVPEHQRWFTCCVDIDHSATNTIGNAVETRRWAKARGFQSLIVVTANFHMPRAMFELGHELPDVVLVPYGVVSDKVRVEAWWGNSETARLLFLEYLKYIVARVRLWLPLSFE